MTFTQRNLSMKAWIITLIGLLLSLGQAQADDSLGGLIKAGDRDAALELVRAGADVNAPQNDGTTPLHWAVYQVDEELTAALLRNEADPNVSNHFGWTPLMEAAKLAEPQLVRLLLEAGADPNEDNQDGQTPLMLAARNGAVEVVELLVEHGADVNAEENWGGQTALMWAAAENHPEVAELLIAKGADVNRRARVFDWATQVTSEPRWQFRPAAGLTTLQYAVRGGCLRCVQAMVEAGADVDLPTPEGVTPLIIAIDNFHFDIANYLLDEGANPHAWDWWGRTPLFVAIDVRTLDDGTRNAPGPDGKKAALELARRLLEAGVHVDPQLNMHRPGRGGGNGRFADDLLITGATPLLRAAISHDVEAVRLLLDHGARVDLPNVMGVTPFIAAAGLGSPRGQLAAGAQWRDPPEVRQEKAIATLEVLLEAGADINARVTDTSSNTANIARHNSMTDRQGQTAMFGPGRWGWLKVAQWLVDHGAKVNVTDDFGKTPVDSALGQAGGEQDERYEELAAFLRDANANG